MSNAATIPARPTTPLPGRHDAVATRRIEDGDAVIDLLTPTPEVDISCWRLLTARVPLTLLLDLALPSAAELSELYDELLEEPATTDWVPAARSARPRTTSRQGRD